MIKKTFSEWARIMTPSLKDGFDLRSKLRKIQKRCRKRLLDPYEAESIAAAINDFLLDCPKNTVVRGGLHERLPQSYKYPADATFVIGAKNLRDEVHIDVRRSSSGFGSRKYIIEPPVGYIARGEAVHNSTGSAHNLRNARVEQK